jgi:hypothetical protein
MVGMRNLLLASFFVALAGCHPVPITGDNHSCHDFIRNGDETDIDCGGATCPACGDGQVCAVAQDCASGNCTTTDHCQEGAFTVAGVQTYAIAGNAGVLVTPGTQAGFAITAAGSGSSFRLVWTGDGNVTNQYHEFYGSVYTDGTFVSVTPGCSGDCSFGANDYVSPSYQVSGGERVDFDSANVNDLDGIDFVVGGGAMNGEPLYFDLFIDGTYQPMAVQFTDATSGQPAFPQTIPFGLLTS